MGEDVKHPLMVERRSGSEATTQDLYHAMRAGKAGARDELIESNINLVIYKVGALLRNTKSRELESHFDDLVSTGIEGLVRGVDNLAGNAHVESAQAYISNAIHRRLQGYLETIPTIRVPRRSLRQRDDLWDVCATDNVGLAGSLVENQDVKAYELYSSILSVCDIEEERKVVEMRAQGFSDAEIAEATGMSRHYVYKLRREIEQRAVEKGIIT